MSVAQIFQGGGYEFGGGCDCFDWECDGKYRRTGYYYRRYGDYYCYNDGCGYSGHVHRGRFLGLY